MDTKWHKALKKLPFPSSLPPGVVGHHQVIMRIRHQYLESLFHPSKASIIHSIPRGTAWVIVLQQVSLFGSILHYTCRPGSFLQLFIPVVGMAVVVVINQLSCLISLALVYADQHHGTKVFDRPAAECAYLQFIHDVTIQLSSSWNAHRPCCHHDLFLLHRHVRLDPTGIKLVASFGSTFLAYRNIELVGVTESE